MPTSRPTAIAWQTRKFKSCASWLLEIERDPDRQIVQREPIAWSLLRRGDAGGGDQTGRHCCAGPQQIEKSDIQYSRQQAAPCKPDLDHAAPSGPRYAANYWADPSLGLEGPPEHAISEQWMTLPAGRKSAASLTPRLPKSDAAALACVRASLACEDMYLTAEEEALFEQMDKERLTPDQSARRIIEFSRARRRQKAPA